MKRIVLVRHAKSSWENLNLSDIDRPLNKRGKRDAPFMAEELKNHLPKISKIITSPAKRARHTARQFSQAYGIKKEDVQIDESLYHGDDDDIMSSIYSLKKSDTVALLFGHNPGFTFFANKFSQDWIDNVPTTGIVCIQTMADKWKDLDESNSQVEFFIFPKMYPRE